MGAPSSLDQDTERPGPGFPGPGRTQSALFDDDGARHERQVHDADVFIASRPGEREAVAGGQVARQARREQIVEGTVQVFAGESADVQLQVKQILESIERAEMRRLILEEQRRADGRRPDEVRPITCEVGVLPRTHGSALFTRGQTQALVTTTLGTSEDVQRLDSIEGEGFKRFMLHYNFPPFSVGEVRFLRGPGRREIGHGALAERALLTVLPGPEEFPYTIRIVSDILESNGSSSMASVCGATLALMDAGVPIKAVMGGVAMGLVMEGDKAAILTDIMGLEDALGDMDFKVAGTRRGVTALQMDVKKVLGVTPALMTEALERAREARIHVLDEMGKTLDRPRPRLSVYAPRLVTVKIPVDKIREVIGPGGKVIRGIIEETGCKINVSDDGRVEIASTNEEAAKKAVAIINRIVEVPEVGKIYTGKVKRILDFGAFVEIPGTDGLLHISQIAEHRIKQVQDVLSEGDEVMVKVIEIDPSGKIRLSRKEVLLAQAGAPAMDQKEERPPRRMEGGSRDRQEMPPERDGER